jgi:hypothetical protein
VNFKSEPQPANAWDPDKKLFFGPCHKSDTIHMWHKQPQAAKGRRLNATSLEPLKTHVYAESKII